MYPLKFPKIQLVSKSSLVRPSLIPHTASMASLLFLTKFQLKQCLNNVWMKWFWPLWSRWSHNNIVTGSELLWENRNRVWSKSKFEHTWNRIWTNIEFTFHLCSLPTFSRSSPKSNLLLLERCAGFSACRQPFALQSRVWFSMFPNPFLDILLKQHRKSNWVKIQLWSGKY